mmetsp:Transcript_16716/g.53247  ORF Transcript_16716/g.53247 Transcript_16716/m.53247 type:complete len:177 (-) Transcript_16716:560-1090(-)
MPSSGRARVCAVASLSPAIPRDWPEDSTEDEWQPSTATSTSQQATEPGLFLGSLNEHAHGAPNLVTPVMVRHLLIANSVSSAGTLFAAGESTPQNRASSRQPHSYVSLKFVSCTIRLAAPSALAETTFTTPTTSAAVRPSHPSKPKPVPRNVRARLETALELPFFNLDANALAAAQ